MMHPPLLPLGSQVPHLLEGMSVYQKKLLVIHQQSINYKPHIIKRQNLSMGKALVTMAWTTSPPPTILTTAPLRCQVRLSRGPVEVRGEVGPAGRCLGLPACVDLCWQQQSWGEGGVGDQLAAAWVSHPCLETPWRQPPAADSPQAETVG